MHEGSSQIAFVTAVGPSSPAWRRRLVPRAACGRTAELAVLEEGRVARTRRRRVEAAGPVADARPEAGEHERRALGGRRDRRPPRRVDHEVPSAVPSQAKPIPFGPGGSGRSFEHAAVGDGEGAVEERLLPAQPRRRPCSTSDRTPAACGTTAATPEPAGDAARHDRLGDAPLHAGPHPALRLRGLRDTCAAGACSPCARADLGDAAQPAVARRSAGRWVAASSNTATVRILDLVPRSGVIVGDATYHAGRGMRDTFAPAESATRARDRRAVDADARHEACADTAP